MVEPDMRDNKRTLVIGVSAALLVVLVGIWALFFRGGAEQEEEEADVRSVSLLKPSTGSGEPESSTQPVEATGRKRPPAAAVKKAYRLKRADDLRHWGAVLAEADPERAVQLLDELAGDWRTIEALAELDDALFRSVIQGWSRKNVAAAAAWAADLPRERRVSGITLVVRQWGTLDAPGAVMWAGDLPASDRHGAYLVLALQLSEKDPGMALKLLEQLPDGAVKQEASSRIARNSSQAPDSLTHALAAIDLLNDGAERRKRVLDVVQRWVPASVDEIAPWLAHSDFSEGRAGAFVETGKRWSAADMDGAAYWADRLPDALDRANALGGVAVTLADENLEQARTLAESLEESPGRSVALETIAVRWVTLDIVSIPAWLETLAVGESRDRAIEAFVTGAYKTEPGTALAWAEVIDDDQRRTRSSLLAGLEWINSDPDAAIAWVESSGLSDELKTQLISSAE